MMSLDHRHPLTAKELGAIVDGWHAGWDTDALARVLGRTEAEVYNALAQIRGTAASGWRRAS